MLKGIMYHYVRPPDTDYPYFRYLRLSDFKKQLSYFKNKYGFMPKSDFLHTFETGIPGNGVILTFDDGFSDHFNHVIPCLLELGLWAIFFIPTGIYRTDKLLDVHRIHVLLGKYGGKTIFNAMKEIVTDDMLSNSDTDKYRSLTYKICRANDEYTDIVKRTLNYYIRYDYREVVLDALMKLFFGDENTLRRSYYMKVQELKQIHNQGMIIGSHGINHCVMSRLSRSDQALEISESFEFLENVTGGLTTRTFCYPYGGFHSFTNETRDLLEKNDCAFAFNVEARDIDGNDLRRCRQALPRYDCNMFPFGMSEGMAL